MTNKKLIAQKFGKINHMIKQVIFGHQAVLFMK